MPAPTVTVWAPPPNDYTDPLNLRPLSRVTWSGGVGPFDVLHEWDDDINFGSPIQDNNTSATSPDTGVPPSDMGAGTWYYRCTVTDTSDSAFTTTSTEVLTFVLQRDFRRYLHLLANVGFGFDTDEPGGGWGPDPDPAGGAPDGFVIDFRRYLYLLGNVGTAFDPTDGTSWETTPPDGYTIDFRRYHYLLGNVGVGFDPTDGTDGGPDPALWPPDGYTIDFRRYHYLLGNVTTDTPTPHIWYLFPTFGREGWEFKIVGYGFGDTQGTYANALARLNALTVGIISWQGFAEAASTLIIDPDNDVAEPVHQEIRATVPTGGQSGLVYVEHDDV